MDIGTLDIEQLVHQREKDLGRRLDWVAAHHYDTPRAHTHMVIRGVANGEAWYMAKSYFEHGIRDRADALLTRMLGRRQQEVHRYQLDQTYAQERLALNGMLRGAGDPDVWRLYQQQQRAYQSQALAGQFGSSRQESGTAAILAQMQQRMQALQHQQQQWQWQHTQRRNDG